MSNARAIAATTATLRNLLLGQVPQIDVDLADLDVTTQPPDLARKGVTKAQLNLFLFETQVAAAWRNHDLPAQVRAGETGTPPLALNLHYLLTAYGRGESDNDATSHRALGSAMGLLHDHALLGSAEIAAALAGNDLDRQIERIRITPRAMSIEELSKLWTIFQTPYRISVAYEVGVVLIDSRRPVRAPLPVLTRGADDRGPVAAAGLLPMLEAVRPPRAQPALRLGEEALVTGANLTTRDTVAVVASALNAVAIELPLTGGAAGVGVRIDDDAAAMARWHPGWHLLSMRQTRAGVPPLSSNALPLAIAPRIVVDPLTATAGDVALTVTCTPRLRDGQRAVLILGDRQVAPDTVTTPADTTQPSTLGFTVPQVGAAGSYVVRLRVDGVDSIPVVASGTPPLPAFDPAQTLVVS